MSETSSQKRLQVDYLPASALTTRGRFGITAMPGRKGPSSTGFHDRDLHNDAADLAERHSVTTLVSFMLLSEYENNGPDLDGSRNAFRRAGIGFEHFPFREGSAPAEESAGLFVALIRDWLTRLEAGDTIVIHSRAGHGRCGLVAACLLVAQGMGTDEAISTVLATREHGIQGAEQREYVHAFRTLWYSETHLLHRFVRQTLDDSGIAYEATLAETDAIGFPLPAAEGEYAVIFLTNERSRIVTSLVQPELTVPGDRRSAVAEFITRVNWMLPLGCLEFSLDDGTLRSRIAVTVNDTALSAAMVRTMLNSAVSLLDRCLPAIRLVAFEGLDPRDAATRLGGGAAVPS